MQSYEAKNGVTYRHQNVIDWMLENPHRPLKEAQEATGFSPQYLYILRRSDFFRAEYDKRRREIDAELHMEMVDRWRELEEAVIEKTLLKLQGPVTERFLTATLDLVREKQHPTPQAAPIQFNFMATPEAILQARSRAEELARGRSQAHLAIEAPPAGENVITVEAETIA